MRLLGWEPMPWQEQLLEVAFEVDAFGQLWYRDITVVIPRQSGKSTIVIPWGMHRMIAWGDRQFMLYIAQTRDKAREKLVEEHFFHINRSPLRRLIVPNRSKEIRPSLVNGSEHIKFINGSKWAIDAPTEDAGHGGTLGLTIGDEIFALRDMRLEAALKPATAAVPDAQALWISTPGESKYKSPFLWSKVERGRKRVELLRLEPAMLDESRTLYVEFSAPDDADIYDPMTWYATMPALGFTQMIETLRSIIEDEGMTEAELRRAFFCQWGDEFVTDWKIPKDKWERQRDPESRITDRLTWVLDVTPDRAWASIGLAAQRDDGTFHVEVVDDGPGTDWLIDGDDRASDDPLHNRGIVHLLAEHGGEVFGDYLTVGALEPDLRDAGVDITWIGADDVRVAAPMILDFVLNGRVFHIGQKRLDDALASASTSTFGDGWKWARGKSMRPITPLVSVTFALRMLAKTLPDLNYDAVSVIKQANRLDGKDGAA